MICRSSEKRRATGLPIHYLRCTECSGRFRLAGDRLIPANKAKVPYLPSPEEIKQRCKAERDAWPQNRLDRMGEIPSEDD
jgi:hypothetical protein